MLISKFDTIGIAEHIANYEAAHGFTFPKQYREFLLKYNGGDTPNTNFKIKNIASDLRGLYGVGKAKEYLNYAIFDKMNQIRYFLEDDIIPVGENVFGDYIVIGIGNHNNGKVFFRYHDRPKTYIPLTEDFTTFVSKCKSTRIGNIATIDERKARLIANGKGDKITSVKIAGWQAEIDRYTNMNQEELEL